MSTRRIYNDAPRPRALLQNLQDDVAGRIEPLFAHGRRGETGEPVYLLEYDILITAKTLSRSTHLHTVAFGVSGLGQVTVYDDQSHGYGTATYGDKTTLATELYVPDGITGQLGHLVHTYLVPYFSALDTKPILSCSVSTSGPRSRYLHADKFCTPFLLSGDGRVLAGAVTFAGDRGGRCWVLPADCPVPETWVAAALKEFHELDPVAVPGLPKWWETPDWATPAQQRARAAVTDLEAEREQLLQDLDQRLTDAQGEVGRADAGAAAGAGRLLTADGDDLAHAVHAAFETFGFAVRDMDQVNAQGQRREDLRVTDPGVLGWEAIVEVKSYTAGAKVNDLAKLLRWKSHYVKDSGRDPDALWHVVNAFRQVDPAARPIPIPDEEDLENLVEENGVLIDTRALFRAQRDVETGIADPSHIRTSLRAAVGRWTQPAASADPGR
ncbi:hypothetical protein [Amycolatopsis sp. lyj-109]|uniref:hypothetical protein n=1 Tax=Amycolatopsis sp. lyj-109 TaxID=2789287 RepID=UPI00397CDBD4